MEFPDYVPPAVRAHLSALMDGSESESQGWAVSLAAIKKQLTEIEGAIKTCIQQGDEAHDLDTFRRQKADVDKRHDRLESDVDCLTRLAYDRRMQEVYIALSQEFTKDDEWRAFIYAAWAARNDYFKYRERLKQAAELPHKIAETAKKLADLLRRATDTGFSWPSEFFSIHLAVLLKWLKRIRSRKDFMCYRDAGWSNGRLLGLVVIGD